MGEILINLKRQSGHLVVIKTRRHGTRGRVLVHKNKIQPAIDSHKKTLLDLVVRDLLTDLSSNNTHRRFCAAPKDIKRPSIFNLFFAELRRKSHITWYGAFQWTGISTG